MITNRKTVDWRDLQEQTATVLRECGFAVEVGKVVSTSHGRVEIDVYAEETIGGRRYRIVCECKHWGSAIPQTIVHALRTVVSDCGANLGYLITSSRYQSGALNAVQFTSVRLLTWEEFLSEFEPSWIEDYFFPTVRGLLHPLGRIIQILLPKGYDDLSEGQQQRLDQIWRGELHTVEYLVYNTPLGMDRSSLVANPTDKLAPALPLRSSMLATAPPGVPRSILDATSYREVVDAVAEYVSSMRKEIDAISPALWALADWRNSR